MSVQLGVMYVRAGLAISVYLGAFCRGRNLCFPELPQLRMHCSVLLFQLTHLLEVGGVFEKSSVNHNVRRVPTAYHRVNPSVKCAYTIISQKPLGEPERPKKSMLTEPQENGMPKVHKQLFSYEASSISKVASDLKIVFDQLVYPRHARRAELESKSMAKCGWILRFAMSRH